MSDRQQIRAASRWRWTYNHDCHWCVIFFHRDYHPFKPLKHSVAVAFHFLLWPGGAAERLCSNQSNEFGAWLSHDGPRRRNVTVLSQFTTGPNVHLPTGTCLVHAIVHLPCPVLHDWDPWKWKKALFTTSWRFQNLILKLFSKFRCFHHLFFFLLRHGESWQLDGKTARAKRPLKFLRGHVAGPPGRLLYLFS